MTLDFWPVVCMAHRHKFDFVCAQGCGGGRETGTRSRRKKEKIQQ